MDRLLGLRRQAEDAEAEYSHVLGEIGAYQARVRVLGEKLRENASLQGADDAQRVLQDEVGKMTRRGLEERLRELQARAALAYVADALDGFIARPYAEKWGEPGIRYAHLCMIITNACLQRLGGELSWLRLQGLGKRGEQMSSDEFDGKAAHISDDAPSDGRELDERLLASVGVSVYRVREEARKELFELVDKRSTDWFANPDFLQGRPRIALLLRLLAEVSEVEGSTMLSLLSETLAPFRRSVLLRTFVPRNEDHGGGRNRFAACKNLDDILAEVSLYTGLIAQGLAVLGTTPEMALSEGVREYVARDPSAGRTASPFVPYGTKVPSGTPVSLHPLYKACSLLRLYEGEKPVGMTQSVTGASRTRLDGLVDEREAWASQAICRTFSVLLSGFGDLLVGIRLAGFHAAWNSPEETLSMPVEQAPEGCGPLSVVHLLCAARTGLEQIMGDLEPAKNLLTPHESMTKPFRDLWRASLLRARSGLQAVLEVREHFASLERLYSLHFDPEVFRIDFAEDVLICFSWWVDEDLLVRPKEMEGCLLTAHTETRDGAITEGRHQLEYPIAHSSNWSGQSGGEGRSALETSRTAVSELLGLFGPTNFSGGLEELLSDVLRFLEPEWAQLKMSTAGGVQSFSLLEGDVGNAGTRGERARELQGLSSPLRQAIAGSAGAVTTPIVGSAAVSTVVSLAPSAVPSAAQSVASTPLPRIAQAVPNTVPNQELRLEANSAIGEWTQIDDMDDSLRNSCEHLLESLCRLSLLLRTDSPLLSRISAVAKACLGSLCCSLEREVRESCSSPVWDYEATGNPRLRLSASSKLESVYPSKIVKLYARIEELAAIQQNASRLFPDLRALSEPVYKIRHSLVRDAARMILLLTAPEICEVGTRCLDLSEHLDFGFVPRAVDAIGRLLEGLEENRVERMTISPRVYNPAPSESSEGEQNWADEVFREYVLQAAAFSARTVIPEMRAEISRRSSPAGASVQRDQGERGEQGERSPGDRRSRHDGEPSHPVNERNAVFTSQSQPANRDPLRRYARAMNATQRTIAESLGITPVDFEGELRAQLGSGLS